MSFNSKCSPVWWSLPAGVFSIVYATALPVAAEHGDPSVAAQLQLEAINRARSDPQAEAQRFGLSSATEGGANVSTTPLPPLAMNQQLTQAALSHSQEMAQKDFFSHSSQNGDSPFDRMRNAGYTYSGAAENVAVTTFGSSEEERSLAMHKNLFVDNNVSGRGHRVNLLSSSYKEIGIGLATGDFRGFTGTYLTTDFARRSGSSAFFLLGVAYNDSNADGAYSAGEALSGVNISIKETGDSTQSASAGGYSLALEDGVYTVVFSHASLGNIERSVTISGQNLKLDVLQNEFSNGGSTGTTSPVSGEEAELQQNASQLSLSLPFVAMPNTSGGQDYWQANLLFDGSGFVINGLPQQRSDTPQTSSHAAQFIINNGQIFLFLPHIKFGSQTLSAMLSFLNNRFVVISVESI